MRANRKTDTVPELRVRSALHRLGLRFRVNQRLASEAPAVVDIVFARAKVAVFVDGCFWHMCAEHGTRPVTNQPYWDSKLRRNVSRDGKVDRALVACGWRVIRVWEHEEPYAVARRVQAILNRASPLSSNGRSGYPAG